MAQFVYTPAMNAIAAGTLPMNVATYKVMLVNASQALNKANQFVSTALTAAEIGSGGAVPGYVRGFGNSGRQAVSLSLTTASNTVECIISANITWNTIGGTVNDTIVGAALIKEIAPTDTTSLAIAYWDFSSPVTTNGSNVTITVNPAGNITFTT